MAASDKARAQISPGPLARPHGELEGANRCFACHGSKRGESSMNDHCLECHKEIAWQVGRGLGLHGLERKEDCASCHPDHAGADFELISWGEGGVARFVHARTGWPLEGGHATVRCNDCHKAAHQTGEVTRLLKRKDRDRSWLGLQRDCASCHDDVHQGTLGTRCLDCHRLTKWKPAALFDHANTVFPLDGKHAGVACEKCHPKQGRPVARFKPLGHGECSACHDDPHRGRLGPACGRCHVTDDFARVDDEAFDHGRTRYPLRGGHAELKCAKCHDPQDAWGKRPAFARCTSCHRDAHDGGATRTGKVVDCDSCHDQRSFKPSIYTVGDHATSAYPLEGRHAEVRCDKCHLKSGSRGAMLRPRHQACRDCHADAHAGQLAGRADRGACESCHGPQGWKPSTFTAASHAGLRLPLTGRHLAVECAACHGPERTGLPPLPGEAVLGTARVALTPLDPGCPACHLDPHAGRLDGCVDCHTAEAFRPARVDAVMHDRFDYPLEGDHRTVPCVLCHEDLKLPPSSIKLLEAGGTPRSLEFELPDRRCADCHRTPHGDQFAHRADGGACEGCHTVDAFRPASRFDHERDSAFALGGAHRGVPCADCHVPRGDRTRYRPLSHRCRDCHGRKVGSS